MTNLILLFQNETQKTPGHRYTCIAVTVYVTVHVFEHVHVHVKYIFFTFGIAFPCEPYHLECACVYVLYGVWPASCPCKFTTGSMSLHSTLLLCLIRHWYSLQHSDSLAFDTYVTYLLCVSFVCSRTRQHSSKFPDSKGCFRCCTGKQASILHVHVLRNDFVWYNYFN